MTTFTLESMDRIAKMVRDGERMEPSRPQPDLPVIQSATAPLWDAITNEAIAADSSGAVELVKGDRATREGTIIQAYTRVGVPTETAVLIVPVGMVDAPETDVRWEIVSTAGGVAYMFCCWRRLRRTHSGYNSSKAYDYIHSDPVSGFWVGAAVGAFRVADRCSGACCRSGIWQPMLSLIVR